MNEYTIKVREDGVIFSATFCDRTGIPALWNADSEVWSCQAHPDSDECLATFRNTSMLDKYAPSPPRWKPSEEEIAEAKRDAEEFEVHHDFHFAVQQPLSIEEYEALYERLEEAFGAIKNFSTGGPIPLPLDHWDVDLS